jgi:hypothetical protein
MISISPAVASAVWFGTWSPPTDRPAQAALAIGAVFVLTAMVPGGARWLASMSDFTSVADLGAPRRFLTEASFAAAFLSLGYVAFYLRGGPRAHEAATYWLEGRALSHGTLSWTAPEPTASFRAENLVLRLPDRLLGVFPPGYPMLLALGFFVGAPMLVGPLIAAALVLATWFLAHEVCADERGRVARTSPPAEAIARLAAGLSIVSAALRYHTADALPYGAAATAVAASFACGLRARRTGVVRLFGVAGLAIGFLVASRPASALAVGVVVAVLACGTEGRRGRARSLGWSCVGALPGLLLLLAANHAATGHALVSARAANSALVGDKGGGAYPLAAAAFEHVREHLLDAANLEPLALLAFVPLFGGPRRATSFTALLIAGEALTQMIVGVGAATGAGGGRMLAAVPLEHVLIAIGVARLCPRVFASAAVGTIGLAIAGFAVHASHAHEALAASDIGRPRFEPDVVREANVSHGLLFFDDDTGYELAADPGVAASHGIEAARLRRDDNDRLLYDSLGHPPAHRYLADAAKASVALWAPSNGGAQVWRFEAESDWPPDAQTGGTVEPIDSTNPCVSNGRALRLTPVRGGRASATLALPLPHGSTPGEGEKHVWMVVPRVLQGGEGGTGMLAVLAELSQAPLAEWTWVDSAKVATCIDLPARAVEVTGDRIRAWLVLQAEGGAVMLDRTTLRPQ